MLDDSEPTIANKSIARPGDAVNVFDFRTVAKEKLSAGHWAFPSTGVDHEFTLRANREGFDKVRLQPRRLVDTRDIDTSLELLGTKLSSPIVLAPRSRAP
jgi:4-hydroxymandelate oxidase